MRPEDTGDTLEDIFPCTIFLSSVQSSISDTRSEKNPQSKETDHKSKKKCNFCNHTSRESHVLANFQAKQWNHDPKPPKPKKTDGNLNKKLNEKENHAGKNAVKSRRM
jgi:hypothetical protein